MRTFTDYLDDLDRVAMQRYGKTTIRCELAEMEAIRDQFEDSARWLDERITDFKNLMKEVRR